MTVNGYGANGDNPRNWQRALAVPVIVPDDHEQMKEHLRPGLKDFCDKLLEGVKGGDRTAMNLYPRIMGAIGASDEINANAAAMKLFGMVFDELRAIVDAHRQSSATSLEQCAEDGLALLKWVCEQEPGRRAGILQALGGSNALALAESNGHD